MDLINKTDPQVMALLLSDAELQRHFFTPINDVFVFKAQDFHFFLDSRKIDNSYTRFANRIGLSTNQKLLRENADVVLDFPFKDCVLSGGQSTEDGTDTAFNLKNGEIEQSTQKRQEIFFNQVLAFDEIDRLLDLKAFANAKRINASGKSVATKLNRNENGEITDNIIIKGNNLIALHTLATQIRDKVKLIYIDPPYNTGNDSFKYNDRFNHSTWLTFMKNRLEIARELLKDDGSIWINLDDNEAHYCKILCDEIFGRENFVSNIVWQHRKSVQSDIAISLSHNHILVYAKKSNEITLNRLEVDDTKYENPDNDPRGKWVATPFDAPNIRPNLTYPITNPNTGETYYPPQGRCWRTTQSEYERLLSENRIVFGKTGNSKPQAKLFLSEAKQKGNSVKTWWDDCGTATEGTKELQKIFETKNTFSTPKPEKLLEKIIHIATQENDIVLDFHLGSGTTAAVAHKMKRQYIGIEQMDYIETITLERMKKVIAGEQGGISKAVNWQGGGELVYCELACLNETAKQQILLANSPENLTALFAEICERYFLKYNVNVQEFAENILPSAEFKALDLNEQKSMILAMLDLNQMYVSYSDMADEENGLNEAEQAFSCSFYGENK
ncbi:DNA methyltransferase [Lonepinella koalarum]|uniref:DNA methyltransferase n=1 Tax=Lonepinella koalarum TaxID=53417 RepID=UPI001E596979|nr:site-specific DNA-methyltransferase [Lonepinella koalarum]